MNQNEFERKLNAIQEVEPDEIDLAMIAQAAQENDDKTISLPEAMEHLERSGRLNIRIPKSLHAKLAEQSKHEGVSLNQLILYKLAK